MELPELPKQLHKIEAKITPKVLAWFRTNIHYSCAIEIKQTNKDTMPSYALLDHQKLALLASNSSKGLTHKLSDAARVRQPYDAFQLVNAPGYVVACFITHKKCLVIPVEEWRGIKFDGEAKFTISL